MPQFYDAKENLSLLQDYCSMIFKTTDANIKQNKAAEIIQSETKKSETERKVAIYLQSLLHNTQEYINAKHLSINKYALLREFFSYVPGLTPKESTLFNQPEHDDFFRNSLMKPTFAHFKDIGLLSIGIIDGSVHLHYLSTPEYKAAAARNWNDLSKLPKVPGEDRLLEMLKSGGPFEVDDLVLREDDNEADQADDRWVKMRKF